MKGVMRFGKKGKLSL
ncbi:hypothetical protein MTR67_051962 [Solanum verrucosum]|uniref:Uncharacterized protein n=2 Tax=Solanaceae TaxID=4070 RepID=A0AAF0ZZJ5_SOLVR|nr:hypothetical protein MTR67_051962 [Solanum verrucosum]